MFNKKLKKENLILKNKIKVLENELTNLKKTKEHLSNSLSEEKKSLLETKLDALEKSNRKLNLLLDKTINDSRDQYKKYSALQKKIIELELKEKNNIK